MSTESEVRTDSAFQLPVFAHANTPGRSARSDAAKATADALVIPVARSIGSRRQTHASVAITHHANKIAHT